MRAAAIAVAAATLATSSVACTWAAGYFHQVSAIRGRVVGKSLGLVQWRWLRQQFEVPRAKLTLHEYRHPADHDVMPVVAETMADGNGNFNFGEVRPGHYVLRIKSANLEDSFDVEVVRNKKTKSILLDISPVFQIAPAVTCFRRRARTKCFTKL